MTARRRLLNQIACEIRSYRLFKALGDAERAADAFWWAKHWRDRIRLTTPEGL